MGLWGIYACIKWLMGTFNTKATRLGGNTRLCVWAARCDCTFEGVPISGGGGRRYNKNCKYANIRAFFLTNCKRSGIFFWDMQIYLQKKAARSPLLPFLFYFLLSLLPSLSLLFSSFLVVPRDFIPLRMSIPWDLIPRLRPSFFFFYFFLGSSAGFYPAPYVHSAGFHPALIQLMLP